MGGIRSDFGEQNTVSSENDCGARVVGRKCEMKQTNGAGRPLGTRCLYWSVGSCISLAAPSLCSPGGVRYSTRSLLSPRGHRRHLGSNLDEWWIGSGLIGPRMDRRGWREGLFSVLRTAGLLLAG